MNISEGAPHRGLSVKTIRYWADRALIAPAIGGNSGYRQYDVQAVDKLHSLAWEVGLDLQKCR